jgi:hypothetical protein
MVPYENNINGAVRNVKRFFTGTVKIFSKGDFLDSPQPLMIIIKACQAGGLTVPPDI